jgi:hypothetical protein
MNQINGEIPDIAVESIESQNQTNNKAQRAPVPFRSHTVQ